MLNAMVFGVVSFVVIAVMFFILRKKITDGARSEITLGRLKIKEEIKDEAIKLEVTTDGMPLADRIAEANKRTDE